MSSFFDNKRILIIAPHEDDELNIAGNLIHSMNNVDNVSICFVTNGDYIYKAKTRQKEAINSLKSLKIKKENIYFLGYSDQSYDAKDHMYTIQVNEIWKSRNNRCITYSELKDYPDFSYFYSKGKEHAQFRKVNFINDIKNLITLVKPELILTVDLDFHPDHIMTSLVVERALGIVLKESNLKPTLFKAFTYENSYLGDADFFELNYRGMKHYLYEDNYLLHNKYYKMDDAIKFSVNERLLTRNLFFNKLFKSIFKYKSQILISHAPNMINSNYCYWIRRTDSITYKAGVSATSGSVEYLSDFLLCDSQDILNANNREVLYDKGIWIPSNDDSQKIIRYEFETKKNIKKFKFYHSLINRDFIENIIIRYQDGEVNCNLKDNMSKGSFVSEINLDCCTDFIEIQVLDSLIKNGFSEIEIYENEYYFVDYKCSKIMVNEHWLNKYYVSKEDEILDLTLYNYNMLKDNLEIVCDLRNTEFISEYKLKINKKSNGIVKVVDKNTKEVYDVVKICSSSVEKIKILFSKIIFKVLVIYQKIYRKLFIR